MPGAMPAIDVNVCSGWNEQDSALYNAMPFFFAKLQVDRRKTWTRWNKFMKKRSWVQNEGDTMRGIRNAPSPHKRQFAFPQRIGTIPKKDIVQTREVTVDANVYRHKFESPIMNFYPDFKNFMSHVNDHSNDIMEKMERFEDIYYRSNIFHQSPWLFVAQDKSVKLLPAPYWSGTGNFAATDGKTVAFLLDAINQITGVGNLSLASVNMAYTIMENDLRIPPFSGSGIPTDDNGLTDLYCLVCSTEAFSQFTFDPYLQQNKNCDLDVVNKSFRGKLFGRVTCSLEDMPLRHKADITFPEPEIIEEGDNTYNKGEAIPNTLYTDPANSPFEYGYLSGGIGYEHIEVGPPPKAFTGDSAPHNFPGMFWNGEVKLTKRFLIPCINDAGETVWEANTYGEFIKFIAQATYGIIGKQRRNIIPLAYKRKRGA